MCGGLVCCIVFSCLQLNNGDRARAVIERVLEKNHISDQKADAFNLYQVTPPSSK